MTIKKLIPIITLLFFASKKINAQVPSYVPTNSLVLWLPFNGNTNDVSGNGNNAVNQGATLTSDRYNNPSSAFAFTNGQFMNLPEIDTAIGKPNRNYSASLWFKGKSGTSGPGVLLHASECAGNYIVLRLEVNNASGIKIYQRCPQLNQEPALANFYDTTQWHNITVVNNCSTGQFNYYFDATLVPSMSYTFNPNLNYFASNRIWQIGNITCASNHFFRGKIDDLAIWKRALSACEVNQLFVSNTPSLNIVTATPSICAGYNATLQVTGANTYTWSNSQNGSTNIVSPSTPTSYSVIGTTSAGCTPSTSIQIMVNQNPTITVNSGAICNGQSFTITPSGANTYTYQGGNAVVSPTANTTYTVIGTSTAGCVSPSAATSTITVNQNPTITVNSGAICNGQSFTITPSGASTYTYQGGNAVVSPTANTTYTVIGTSTAGCVSQTAATSTITVNQNPTITVNSGAICNGQSFTITPSGASTYTYQGGNAAVSPTANTTYTVIGTSIAGCVSPSAATSTITVNQNPTITVNSGAICNGQSFTITPSGASTYTYQGGNAAVSPTANTTYTVIGTSTAGCVSPSAATSTVTVNQNPTITVNSSTICAGETATLSASGANTYTWSNNANTSLIVVSPTVTANYTVSGTSNNCTSTQTLVVFVNPCTGLNEIQIPIQLSVHPNPNNGEFIIQSEVDMQVNIIDQLGRKVAAIEVKAGNNNYFTQNLSKGIYLLTGNSNGKVYKGKVVVN
jgi:hypothetical protein